MNVSTNQYVPEFAIIVGVFFGLVAIISGTILNWGLTATVFACATGSYPFIGFGVLRDENPAETIRPRWVLILGALIGMLGTVGTLYTMFGGHNSVAAVINSLFIGFILMSPPASYAVHYGVNVNPLTPQVTAGGCLLVGIGCMFVGLISVPLIGVLLGSGIGVSGALYATARGVTPTQQTKRQVAVLSGIVGITVAFIGTVGVGYVGNSGNINSGEWLFVGAAIAFAPSLYTALTGGQTSKQESAWFFNK